MSSAIRGGEAGEATGQGTRRWLKLLRNSIATAIIAGFGYYLWMHRDAFGNALEASVLHIAVLVLLILVSWYISGVQSALIFRAVEVPLTMREGVMLTIAGTFGNYLPMRAGTLIRAYYLKERHGLRYARFGGVSGMRALLTIVAAGMAGLMGLLVASGSDDMRVSVELIAVFVSLMLGPLVIMLVPIPVARWLPGRMRQILLDVIDAYDTLRNRPKLGLFVVVLLLAQYLILGLRFVVSADAIGADLPLGFLLMMAPLAALMSYLALTPGGVGLREAVMGYVSLHLGYSFAEGLFIGTVDRAVLLACVALVGGATFFLLWRRLPR